MTSNQYPRQIYRLFLVYISGESCLLHANQAKGKYAISCQTVRRANQEAIH
jgi:hypothetical protein